MACLETRPMAGVSSPGCKQRVPDGTVRYFVRNDTVQEQAGEGLRWLLDRHPKSDLPNALRDAVETLCSELHQHAGDATWQLRSVKGLRMLFKEYPESLQHVPDAASLVNIIVAALRRHPANAEFHEAGDHVLALLVVGHGELLINHVCVFVDALARHPEHIGVQEAAALALGGLLRAPVDAVALASQATERGAVKLLVASVRKYLSSEDVVTAAVGALAAILENYPRGCAQAAELNSVGILRDALAEHPGRAELQAGACHALAQLLWRQPSTSSRAASLKVEEVLLKALENHGDRAEVQVAASTATAWLVTGCPDSAEAVALAGIAEAMMDGVRKHMRIKPVQEAVCHALSKLFDESNAMFTDNVRNTALSLILELLHREPGCAGTQIHASFALANLCARHAGSAHDAAMAGAFELLLAAHRHHFQDALLQSNALLAIARIVESHPSSANRAAVAGATARFADALKEVMLDDRATGHVAAALAQLHTLAIQEDPCNLPAMQALANLLQRHPASGAGAARAGAAEALPAVLLRWADDPAAQAAASCALGRLFQTQPGYTTVAITAGAVDALLAALRRHPSEREVQAQVSKALVLMMQALPVSAAAVHGACGDELLAEAVQLHPEAEDVKASVSTAFRQFGKFVPALTHFPFVPAEPPK